MFSFGLFSAILPFMLMLVVSIFGVASHFFSNKSSCELSKAETKEVIISAKKDIRTDTYNPFTNDEIASDECLTNVPSGLISHKNNSDGWHYRHYVFISADFAQSYFSRPPPPVWRIATA